MFSFMYNHVKLKELCLLLLNEIYVFRVEGGTRCVQLVSIYGLTTRCHLILNKEPLVLKKNKNANWNPTMGIY